MISRLPRWFWCCAWVLALIAGILNVIGVLGFTHQTVSHLTGSTSMLAIALGTLDLPAALHFGIVIGSFLIGAILSGFIIQSSVLQLGHRYGVVLWLESFFICLSVPLLRHQSLYGVYCLACACGLQNAMVSAYSGTVVRTTHVSGMFTDLGIFVGHAMRGLPIDFLRMRMSLLVISGFLTGGIIGTVLFNSLGYSALFIPAVITATAAFSYGIYQLRKMTKKNRQEQKA